MCVPRSSLIRVSKTPSVYGTHCLEPAHTHTHTYRRWWCRPSSRSEMGHWGQPSDLCSSIVPLGNAVLPSLSSHGPGTCPISRKRGTQDGAHHFVKREGVVMGYIDWECFFFCCARAHLFLTPFPFSLTFPDFCFVLITLIRTCHIATFHHPSNGHTACPPYLALLGHLCFSEADRYS